MTAPSTARDRLDGPHELPTWRLVARTCAAEWTRLWTVRAAWWCVAAAAVVMVAVGAMAGDGAAADPVPPQGDPAWSAAGFGALPAQFALLALSLTAVTSDYATGGILPTLQWTTRREVLFLARTLVAVGAATVVGVVLGIAAALAAFAMAGPVLSLRVADGLEALGAVAFVIAAGAALAVGLGFLLRATAGALVTVFLVMLVLPIMLPNIGFAWMPELARALPGTGATFLLVGQVPEMTTASSVAVLLAWAGGALLLGGLRVTRQDADR